MFYLKNEQDFFWSAFLQGVAFTNDLLVNYRIEVDNRLGPFAYTILDTGSSHLFIPTSFFEALIYQIV
jgi:hypothetical protein